MLQGFNVKGMVEISFQRSKRRGFDVPVQCVNLILSYVVAKIAAKPEILMNNISFCVSDFKSRLYGSYIRPRYSWRSDEQLFHVSTVV